MTHTGLRRRELLHPNVKSNAGQTVKLPCSFACEVFTFGLDVVFRVLIKVVVAA
jgi:hypothetical protein